MRLLQNPWIPLLVQLLQAHTRRQLRFWHLLSPWWDPYRSYRWGHVRLLGSQGRALELDGAPVHWGWWAALFALPVLYGAGSPARLGSSTQQPEPALTLFCSSKQRISPPRPPSTQGSSADLHTQERDDSGRIDASGSQTIKDWRRVVFFSE